MKKAQISLGSASDVLRFPLITEKSTNEAAFDTYTFCVEINADKPVIAAAVEKIFHVKVKDVRTARFSGKKKLFRGRVGRRSHWKKARVVLQSGEKKLDFVGGAF